MRYYCFGIYHTVGTILLNLASGSASDDVLPINSTNSPSEAEGSSLQNDERAEAAGNIDTLAQKLSTPNKTFKFTRTPDLVKNRGYPMETHTVVTKSGYLLELHRIPGPKLQNNTSSSSAEASAETEEPIGAVNSQSPGPPVILTHGLWQSSFHFVASNPENSLAFILADEGYDVWLANSRGNCYSNQHVSLKTSDNKYWNFNLDDMGGEDLYANIDYILRTTGYESLQYIGYSNGNQVFFAGSSLHPEYNNKVKLMIALSPMAFMSNTKSSVMSMSHLQTTTLFYEMIQNSFGYSPIPDAKLSGFIKSYVNVFCAQNTAGGAGSPCSSGLFGINIRSDSTSATPDSKTGMQVDACPTSSKTVIHMSQLINSNQFEQYDYREKNIEIYGQLTPLLYKLWTITVPVALIWSKNDAFNDPSDVEKLARSLPHVVENYQIPSEGFLHTDFLFGQNAKELVYYKVLQLLKKYN